MSKNKKNQQLGSSRKPVTATKTASSTKVKGGARKHWPLLPIPIVVFILIWLWVAIWQGDVFRMVRENSFFAPNELLMHYELQKEYGVLWTIGRALLTTFRYPWFGGIVLSLILTACCWLFGYALRLKAGWRWIQYLPLGIFTGIFTYQGLNNWYEAESGQVMGIPFCILVVLVIWGIIIRSFSRKPVPAIVTIPKDETPRQNRLQLYAVVLMLAIPMIFAHFSRPYVRPIAKMQVAVMNQDWQKVIDIAHDNSEMSYRPIAANYAIALVQTGQIGEKLFDIRLDYDSLYLQSMSGEHTISTSLYQMECDFHAGLTETSYHHAMESMAMEGPTIRNLKMMCKSALVRNEWDVAERYLTVLDKVPFEGEFIEKYRPMLRDTAKVNADREFAMIKLTEPVRDAFENQFIQPAFLGYNAGLLEGRSINALWNSLMVHIYTKTMQDFIYRCQPLKGTTPPTSIAEALTLMSNKQPELLNLFSGLDMHRNRLAGFVEDTKQYMSTPEDRAKHAKELFPKYKGYYPYYYFFGNLKATKKKAKTESSNAGVN